jgi:hypothetical protein
MTYVSLHPVVVFVLTFGMLWLAAWAGARYRRSRHFAEEARQDYNLILAASLTLLGLLIGFSFSMAATRYDQRKNLEEAEANAIGTQYLRADLLETADRARLRTVLVRYVELRIRFYLAPQDEVARIDADTARLQNEMWAAVAGSAARRTDPLMALVIAGMNDVINSQGFTQAAWWNRIPLSAVLLLAVIAVGCNLLVGYGAHSMSPRNPLLAVMPLLIAVAVSLIDDIDTPRHGLIQVMPTNLTTLLDSLKSHGQ